MQSGALWRLNERTTRKGQNNHPVTLFDDWGNLLLPRSGRETAVLIGGGPSVNDLDEESYVTLRAHADIWGVNFIAKHPFIEPDYNSLELDKGFNEYCQGWPKKRDGQSCCQVCVTHCVIRPVTHPFELL